MTKHIMLLLVLVGLVFAGGVNASAAEATSGGIAVPQTDRCEGWRCWEKGYSAGRKIKALNLDRVGNVKRYKQGYWSGIARAGESHGKFACSLGRDTDVAHTIKQRKFRRAYKMGFRSGKRYIRQVYGPCKASKKG